MAGELPFGLAPSGALTNYQPTLRERVTDWLRQSMFSDDREGQQKADRLVNVGETVLPPFGFATGMYDMGRAGGEGDYLTAGTIGAMAMMPGGKKGIRAYHGSPHSFDKFSMDKIGTGEGAQAYGHGLYFAENEGIARSYRDTLSGKSASAADRTALQGKDHLVAAAKSFRDGGYGPDETIAEIAKTYKVDPDLARAAYERANPGSMYEVEINADPDTFLDWDKPLSEQPEAVQSFANSLKDKSFLARKRLEDTTAATGKDVWEKARNAFGVGQADAATKALSEAGIPGIKYLDAGSRGAGDGTRNYVVFDDSLISIVRKYGIAGASAMLGYNLLDGLSEAEAAELKSYEGGQ